MTATIQRTPTGRADLLRAFVARKEEGLRAAADLLGYVEVRGEEAVVEAPGADPAAAREIAPDESQDRSTDAPTTPTDIEYDDIPYWRAVAVERAEDHEPGEEPLEPLIRDQLARDPEAIPPERPPLVEWPILRRVLDERLRSPRESHRIDVDRLASSWCRGEIPRRLPREVRRHLGRVSLIVDRDRRLAPFWDDQADLVRELVGSLAPTDLRLLPTPANGSIPSSALDENDVVLSLGDLGFYAESSEPWLRLARRLRRTGARLWALVPCPPRRWHQATARAWSATDWSAPDRAPIQGDPDASEAATLQVLRLLAMTVRIEPGLVRSLRRLVPGADCGVEVDLQHHPDLVTGSSSAWQFDGDAIHDRRAELMRLPEELLRAAADVVIRWHRHLPAEVRIELAEVLRDLGLDSDDSLGLTEEQALRLFEGVASILEQDGPTDARLASAVETWLPRIAEQLPRSTWRGRLGKPLVRAYRAYQEKHPEAQLPPGVTPEMLSGRGSDLLVTRWDIRQAGDRLRIEPANAWGEGSYVATVSAREPVIYLGTGSQAAEAIDVEQGIDLPVPVGDAVHLVTDVEAVVLESTPGPAWAKRTGRDGYGLWASFEMRGVEQRMRWIPPGRFWMGALENEEGHFHEESSRHLVTLTRGRWIAETPCTQELWEVVLNENPSRFRGPKRPVEQVSWEEAQGFLTRLSFRIPNFYAELLTEAEWEYSCRASTETPTWLGTNSASVLEQIAVFESNSQGATHDVGSREANPWGLKDMLGNVFEWCWDRHGSYGIKGTVDPEGPGNGSYRVLRGGSFDSEPSVLRAAYRLGDQFGVYDKNRGFRISAPPAEDRVPTRQRADAIVKTVWRATNRRVRSRRSRSWIEQLGWAVDGGTDQFGRWAELRVEGVTHRLRWIYPGRFRMGSPGNEAGRSVKEGPRHDVELTEGFWLGEVPCTQALYKAVMGDNPSYFQSDDSRAANRPVERVNWEDCGRFFEQLQKKVPEFSGRLPTEAEWEYACRADTETATWLGDLEILGKGNAPLLDTIAWYGGNSGVDFDLDSGVVSSGWSEKQYPHVRAGTCETRRKRPNPWGLYDMLGNVWEWCQDAWGGEFGYSGEDRIDPVEKEGLDRVLRGGSWATGAQGVRAAYRGRNRPTETKSSFGFRLCSDPSWQMAK